MRERKLSFTMAMIYAVSECVNRIEEFRYRFVDGKVVLFERIDTAFTYLDADTELFKVVNVPMKASMEKYVAEASRVALEQKEYFTGPLGNDVFSDALGVLYAYFPYECGEERQCDAVV